MSRDYPQIKRLLDADRFLTHLDTLGVSIPFNATPDVDALAAPITIAGRPCPNRFAVLPMEGWDGTADGRPTDLVRRRWQRFGTSGAGLVWGGEAFAVTPEGRANPRQLCAGPTSAADLEELRSLLGADQVTGLQLTHSGRWSTPSRPGRNDPLLDRRRCGPVLNRNELEAIAAAYVDTAVLARDAGFDFVDVKVCHGYLLHELLGADGPLADRAWLHRAIVDGIRRSGVPVGVRISAFDVVPHLAGPDGIGRPEADGDWGFNEPVALLELLGADLVCVTGGSPYYCPHAQRPAYFPPSDGYSPPEDPLIGVSRLLKAAANVKAALPAATVVASGLSYLQEHVPNVASALVGSGWADLIGLGRMMLSYPELPADVLAGRAPATRKLCRTFSDCTTAPRNGLVSGCWPLDDFYKQRDDRQVLVKAKRDQRV
jgi:NADPH2 dehydrogenase